MNRFATKRKRPFDPRLRARVRTWISRQIVATVDAQICLVARHVANSKVKLS